MAFFDNARLPEDIERGAIGGPGFKTTVITLSSGFERRNRDWARSRGEWDISYGMTHKSLLEGAINLFYIVGGKADGFRFKDFSDFQIGDTFTFDVDTRQPIGLGDDANDEFQIFKRYEFGALFFDREINKVVDGTYRVYLDGVLQTESVHYTIDINTGLITFTTPPASTGGSGPGGEEVVEVITEFDVPVRFDTDMLQISTEVFHEEAVISLPNIKLLEIRV